MRARETFLPKKSLLNSFGEVERTALLVLRIYAQRFPKRSHPNVRVFSNLKQRFKQTAWVEYKKIERVKTVIHEENQVLVAAAAAVQNPHESTWNLSVDYNRNGQCVKLKNKMFSLIMLLLLPIK